jgi:hypothetical protein
MEASQLLLICVSAFIAVFVVLSLLAIIMHIIIILFPEKGIGGDAALLAAITTTISKQYPGTKITKIEERK